MPYLTHTLLNTEYKVAPPAPCQLYATATASIGYTGYKHVCSTFASSPLDATASFDGSDPAPPLMPVVGLSSPTERPACLCKTTTTTTTENAIHVRASASCTVLRPTTTCCRSLHTLRSQNMPSMSEEVHRVYTVSATAKCEVFLLFSSQEHPALQGSIRVLSIPLAVRDRGSRATKHAVTNYETERTSGAYSTRIAT